MNDLDREGCRGSIFFVVYGTPAPQGSKNQFGGEASPRTRPWRAAVTAAAAEAMDDHGLYVLLNGPIQLKISFVFSRPKSHYGTGKNATVLKESAPEYVTRAPDVDKLARAVADSLSGVVYRDDAQIAHLTVWKEYGIWARADIEIRLLREKRRSAFAHMQTKHPEYVPEKPRK